MNVREALRNDVLDGARMMLGCDLVRGELRARIVEVEAYRTPDDPGCHAHRGRTNRNEIMFAGPGLAYLYFNYGVHWMLNVTAHDAGDAAAVLIRAARPIEGLDLMRERRGVDRDRKLLSGPGKICQAFGLSRTFYGIDLLAADSELRIESRGERVRSIADVRIGLAKGKGDDLPWRFLDAAQRPWWSQPIQRFKPMSGSISPNC